MDKKVEIAQLKKALQYLSSSLDRWTALEAIVAGIIISKNLNNVGRPIGLINLGRNMIKEMSTDNDTEIIVYTNLLNSILNEEKDNLELLPGYSNINQNWVDQYLNNRFNKREIKEIRNFMGSHNMIREIEGSRNSKQFECAHKEYMPYPNYRPYHPQMNFKRLEKPILQSEILARKIKKEDTVQSESTERAGSEIKDKSVPSKLTKGKK